MLVLPSLISSIGGCRRYGKAPLAVVMTPTRELAKQVETELKDSAPNLELVCVYGGVSIEAQVKLLQRGVDIAVGTPGRFIDLLERGALNLREVKYIVLDEADRMLAVGFVEAIQKIFSYLPPLRQSMLFSATMPAWVQDLSRRYLKNPLIVDLVRFHFSPAWHLLSCCLNHGSDKMTSDNISSSFAY